MNLPLADGLTGMQRLPQPQPQKWEPSRSVSNDWDAQAGNHQPIADYARLEPAQIAIVVAMQIECSVAATGLRE
jgi:hypothetical protein